MKYKDILTEYKFDKERKYECEHFGSCGGCTYQGLSHDEQLELKKKYVTQLFSEVIAHDFLEFKIIHDNSFRYRNKMDFVYAFWKLGLRKRGDFKGIVSIENCKLIPKRAEKVFQKIKMLLKEKNILSYSFLSNKGYLRYVVFRNPSISNQLMVNFIINGDDISIIQPVIDEIKDEVDSIIISNNNTKTDVSFGEVIKTINAEFITEKLDNIEFKILPNSFFQSNSQITLLVYKKILEFIDPESRVLDLYSGVGSISLFAAQKAKKIIGVEVIEDAVISANENKTLNKIDNVKFVHQDVKNYLNENRDNIPEIIILDPPRSGMVPKVLKRILEFAPQKIIYLSCNPDALRRDIEQLSEIYEITFFQPYDMFPQTYHLEILVVFERK